MTHGRRRELLRRLGERCALDAANLEDTVARLDAAAEATTPAEGGATLQAVAANLRRRAEDTRKDGQTVLLLLATAEGL